MSISGKNIILLIGVSLAGFIGNADFGIVTTAMPAIQTQLHTTFIQIQWVSNAFAIALGVGMITNGKLADILGRRRIFYTGLVLFLIASGIAGSAFDIHVLIFARALQGWAASILFTSSGSLVNVSFKPELRAKAMGLFWGIMMMGLAIGPVLGGIITHYLSWRWVFFINFPLIFISLIMCVVTVPSSANHRLQETIDWWGFILLTITILCLDFAILSLTSIPVNYHRALLLLVVTIIAGILLYFRETRYKHPLISTELFRQRRFSINCFMTFGIGTFYGVAFFVMPLYLNNARGLTILQVGLFMLPTTVMLAILSSSMGKIIEAGASLKALVAWGFLVFALGSGLQMLFTAATSLWLVMVPLLILGIGWGLTTNPTSVIALESGPDTMSGVILGTIWTTLNIGNSCGTAIAATFFHMRAKSVLLQDLTARQLHFASQKWINYVISDPTHAIGILMKKTNLPLQTVHRLFADYFMAGYHVAMLFLMLLALATLFLIIFFMHAHKESI